MNRTSKKTRKNFQNSDGYITTVELRQVLTNIGATINDQDVEDMITGADADGDGKVNFEGSSSTYRPRTTWHMAAPLAEMTIIKILGAGFDSRLELIAFGTYTGSLLTRRAHSPSIAVEFSDQ